MKSEALTTSDKTLVTVTEETLHPEGAMLSLVLTKSNAKWLGALLSPADAHLLALHLYEWAAGQDAAFRPVVAGGPSAEHQGSRKVTVADVYGRGPAPCLHAGCQRKPAVRSFYCRAHQVSNAKRQVAP